jgi:hypothetical protein
MKKLLPPRFVRTHFKEPRRAAEQETLGVLSTAFDPWVKRLLINMKVTQYDSHDP